MLAFVEMLKLLNADASSLVSISFNFNDLTDDACWALLDYAHQCPSLTTLELFGNRIGMFSSLLRVGRTAHRSRVLSYAPTPPGWRYFASPRSGFPVYGIDQVVSSGTLTKGEFWWRGGRDIVTAHWFMLVFDVLPVW